ncbi:ABC transporter ATP-binding protein [Dolosicoccus paucivorans]|uniref:Multidrug ABC transporter permease/ATP-binding protein n=1 Tax=Dolosicoccus paucivorans TaxID=84521 RepID=A0A2N6SN29_9LACT|nr:ABC transporter transmembrane domain-containing protein [Dolosicoccus paucivorans]PMB84346.1 multidrug ABC transporter permease/ATP-binding protein [Dolosicoccus paucivorans]PMC58484.1 multidrug ABC transporter permease/ATP-binding protein [Dolosicoccus paucivorans]
MDIFKQLGWFFKKEKVAYITGVLGLIVVAILSALVPLIISRMIDSMNQGTLQMNDLWLWIGMLIGIAVLQYGLRYIWRMAIHGTATRLEFILRQRLYNHFMAMDEIFFQKYRTGDLMAHATNDLNAIRMVASAGILTFVDSISQGLITLIMMFAVVDWRLALASVIPLPLLTIMFNYNGKKVHYHFKRAQAAFSSLNDKVQESVTGMKVIKTFGEETLDTEDFDQMVDEVIDTNQSVYFYDALFRPTIQIVMSLCTIIAVVYGGALVIRGEITVGLLVAFLSYILRMTWPMIAIGRLFNILERGSASYSRIQSLLEETSHIQEANHPVVQSIDGPLDFNIDSFTYPNENTPQLSEVSFHLEEGQTLGIVGATGAGKTTVFKLLLREFDHYKGKICYNGVDIKDYQLDSLLSQIGYVPQDNFLFSTTVRDNIRFGRMGATQQEVEEVAKLTAVHEDILSFADGYDTRVGERGVSLSGGQQQRISMARAMIMNPELLILDDSLSAVDAKTETAILGHLKKYRQNKTTIIAAHRMSSVMHADEIIVIDEGTVIERGTHQSLYDQDGWYRKMYDKQQLEQSIQEEEIM